MLSLAEIEEIVAAWMQHRFIGPNELSLKMSIEFPHLSQDEVDSIVNKFFP